MPESYRANMTVLEQRAEVIEVGSNAWADERARFLGIPLWKRPRARPGDEVIVTKFAGWVFTASDGTVYRMVNDRDIFAVKEA